MKHDAIISAITCSNWMDRETGCHKDENSLFTMSTLRNNIRQLQILFKLPELTCGPVNDEDLLVVECDEHLVLHAADTDDCCWTVDSLMAGGEER